MRTNVPYLLVVITPKYLGRKVAGLPNRSVFSLRTDGGEFGSEEDRISYSAGSGNGAGGGGDRKGVKKRKEGKILYYYCLTPNTHANTHAERIAPCALRSAKRTKETIQTR